MNFFFNNFFYKKKFIITAFLLNVSHSIVCWSSEAVSENDALYLSLPKITSNNQEICVPKAYAHLKEEGSSEGVTAVDMSLGYGLLIDSPTSDKNFKGFVRVFLFNLDKQKLLEGHYYAPESFSENLKKKEEDERNYQDKQTDYKMNIISIKSDIIYNKKRSKGLTLFLENYKASLEDPLKELKITLGAKFPVDFFSILSNWEINSSNGNIFSKRIERAIDPPYPQYYYCSPVKQPQKINTVQNFFSFAEENNKNKLYSPFFLKVRTSFNGDYDDIESSNFFHEALEISSYQISEHKSKIPQYFTDLTLSKMGYVKHPSKISDIFGFDHIFSLNNIVLIGQSKWTSQTSKPKTLLDKYLSDEKILDGLTSLLSKEGKFAEIFHNSNPQEAYGFIHIISDVPNRNNRGIGRVSFKKLALISCLQEAEKISELIKKIDKLEIGE